MRRFAFLAVFMVLSLTVRAAFDDQLLTFSTTGPDRYADGSIVRDGEFYAVVRGIDGAAFGGFTTLGELVDGANNELICRVPLARDGMCPRVTLEVPAETFGAGDAVHLVLLDTRAPATGAPGAGHLILGATPVQGGAVDVSAMRVATVAGLAATRGGARAARLPRNIPQPRIARMELRDGRAVLHVTGTVPGVYYTVQSAETVTGFRAPVLDAWARADTGEGEVIFTVPAGAGSSGFFKVGVPSLEGGDL